MLYNLSTCAVLSSDTQVAYNESRGLLTRASTSWAIRIFCLLQVSVQVLELCRNWWGGGIQVRVKILCLAPRVLKRDFESIKYLFNTSLIVVILKCDAEIYNYCNEWKLCDLKI